MSGGSLTLREPRLSSMIDPPPALSAPAEGPRAPFTLGGDLDIFMILPKSGCGVNLCRDPAQPGAHGRCRVVAERAGAAVLPGDTGRGAPAASGVLAAHVRQRD